MDSRTLAQVLRIATIGDIDANVAKYAEGERRLPIRVRLPESARTQLDVIRNLQVPILDGQTTPLVSVADIDFQAGPGKIIRYDRERRVAVEADLAGNATLGDALQETQKLPIMRNLPPGVQPAEDQSAEAIRSEERRVGKEGDSKCRS